MCVNIILQPKKPFLFLENYYDTTNYKMIIKRISARPCDLTRCYVIYVYAYAVKKFSSACELFYLILYVGCHIMLLYNAVCIIFVLRTTSPYLRTRFIFPAVELQTRWGRPRVAQRCDLITIIIILSICIIIFVLRTCVSYVRVLYTVHV